MTEPTASRGTETKDEFPCQAEACRILGHHSVEVKHKGVYEVFRSQDDVDRVKKMAFRSGMSWGFLTMAAALVVVHFLFSQ